MFLFFLVAGEAFDSSQPLNFAVCNIISSMVYGSRFEYEDPELQAIVKLAFKGLQYSNSPAIKVYYDFKYIYTNLYLVL